MVTLYGNECRNMVGGALHFNHIQKNAGASQWERTFFTLEKGILVKSVVVLLPLSAGRAAEAIAEEPLMP